MGKHQKPRLIHTVMPDDGVFRFTAVVRGEGLGRRITVPAPFWRGLERLGWVPGVTGPGVRARVDDSPTFITWPRRASKHQVVMAIPLRMHRQVPIGGTFRVELEAVTVTPTEQTE